MKQIKKIISERQLKAIITESIKEILNNSNLITLYHCFNGTGIQKGRQNKITESQIRELSAGISYDAYNISNTRDKNATRTQQFRQYFEDKLNAFKNDPKFLNWFQGSVVVDKNGKPMECFHGGERGYDFFMDGTWFSEDETYSLDYRRDNWGMYVVFLNIRNPFDLGDLWDNSDEDIINENWIESPRIQKYIQMLGIKDVEEFKKDIENDYVFDADFNPFDCIYDITNTEAFKQYVKQAGYDGMHSLERNNASCWCIFNESQVCCLNFNDRNQRPY